MIGGNAETMRLALFNGTKLLANLNSDDARISSYKIEKGTCLHVDDDPDTFFDEKLNVMKIDDRCLVSINGIDHSGTIKYKGAFHRKSGIHVGVQFDEGVGDNDGRYTI